MLPPELEVIEPGGTCDYRLGAARRSIIQRQSLRLVTFQVTFLNPFLRVISLGWKRNMRVTGGGDQGDTDVEGDDTGEC